MEGYWYGWNQLGRFADVLLAVLLAAALYGVLYAVSSRSAQRSRRLLTYKRKRARRRIIERCLLIPKAESLSYKTKQSLLSGCGFRIEAGLYMMIVRFLAISALLIGVLLVLARREAPHLISQSNAFLGLCAVCLILFAAACDPYILVKLQRVRRYRIMRDIDVLSRQLLYYSFAPGNLHGKLMRCLPFAKAIRNEWYMLTGEWYQNAEYALRRFQERVATEEGTSFAETLNALRQYESERYYALLKQRIADYKEKLALFKESRKESASYLLFVMSGLPIMYTFRVFVYPWVAEGQKLFDSLG